MSSGAPVTFLFTDLAGSTRLLDTVGSEAFDALRRGHYAVLRDAVTAHGGEEVKNLGDGLMVAFAAPADGLACAIAMQRGVLRQGEQSPHGPLGLRVGLAVGTATRDDGDYFGVAVVVAKRLCDLAEPGTILASSLVAGLAAGGDFRFSELGALELKGLSEPTPSVEVLWEPAAGQTVPLPPALVAARSAAFIGRSTETAVLERALATARSGVPPVVAVGGEPGIGKTRLIGHFAGAAHESGAAVLFGRCYQEALIPYQPFVEALRHYASTCPLDEIRSQLNRDAAELARLVPDLADRVPSVAAGPIDEPEGERYRLFEAVRHLLATAAATRPVVLIIDDAHWADRATLSLLGHLTRQPAPEGLLVLTTYRDAEGAESPFGETLAALHRERDVERLSLAGLPPGDLGAMVELHAGGAVPEGFVEAMHEETDGNPFFTQEVVRHLVESGGIRRQADGSWAAPAGVLERGIPEGVRDVVGRRVATLGPDVERVLAAAAVLGREFRPARLESYADLAGTDIAGALEQALDARLIEEAPGFAGRYRFGHAITRETIYLGLSAPRRAGLHRQAGEALERAYPDAEGAHLAELAHHYFGAASLAGVERAIDYAVRAGAWATGQAAYEEAAGHYRRALDALAQQDFPSDRRRCELLLTLGSALWRSGEIEDAREAFRGAAQLAEATRDPERLGHAALGLVGPFNTAGTSDPEHVRTVERALELLPPDPSALRARLLGRLADLLSYSQADEARRHELGREAVEMARVTGDQSALADVLHAVHLATWTPDNLDERLVAAAEMARLVDETGDSGLAGYGHTWRLACELTRGDRDAADRVLAEQQAEAERLHRPSEIWQVAVHRAMVALLEGRLDEVEPIATEAFGLATAINNAVQIYGVQLMFLRREQGRAAEMLDLVKTYHEQGPEFVAWRCAYAWIASEAGRPEEAREILGELLSDDLARIPRDNLYIGSLMGLSDAAARLGDTAAAEQLRHHLAPFAEQAVVIAPVALCHGAAARCLGAMHALAGDGPAADVAFATALEVNARLRAVPAHGHTQVDYAESLLRRGGPGAADRAAALVGEASATAARLRLPYLAARCEAFALKPSPGRSSRTA